MERGLLEAISVGMDDAKVVGNGQHGFTKGELCLTNAIAICDDMTTYLDDGSICLDSSKVFDVSHMASLCPSWDIRV